MPPPPLSSSFACAEMISTEAVRRESLNKKKKKVGRVMTNTSRSSVFIARKSEGDDKWKKGSCRPLGDGVTGREVERGMRFF